MLVNDGILDVIKKITVANLANFLNVTSGLTKIQVGSYTGTGTYGASNPNSITCSFAPKLVIVLLKSGIYGSALYYNGFIWIRGITQVMTQYGSSSSSMSQFTNQVTLSGNTLSWYNGKSNYYQCNDSNKEYSWIALS